MPLLHRPERTRSRKKNLAHRIVDVGRLYLSMLDKLGVPQRTLGDATEPLSEV